MLLYYILVEFGTEFEAAVWNLKNVVTPLMMYYNDIHRGMAAIYRCVNGFVFHS